jgi:REP element-mobilizing transposase RayT
MSTRSVSFAPGEWFHCYTRGVDKRQIFMDEHDSDRYQVLLYACNGARPIHISNLSQARQGPALTRLLDLDRGAQLVQIGAYCLMSNHLHLLLREIDYGGISAFMQKIGTAYTMYFNKKQKRTGALFSGRFKAIHVSSDLYFRRLVNYIHANPAELYESGWKKGIVRDVRKLERRLMAYPYSSLPDYEGVDRAHCKIIDKKAALESLTSIPSFKTLFDDALVFCRQENEALSELER